MWRATLVCGLAVWLTLSWSRACPADPPAPDGPDEGLLLAQQPSPRPGPTPPTPPPGPTPPPQVGDALSRRSGADVRDVQLHRETLGLEKTLLDGRASVGLRLPLNTIQAESGLPGVDGGHTAVGDLSVILKYAFWQDSEGGDVL